MHTQIFILVISTNWLEEFIKIQWSECLSSANLIEILEISVQCFRDLSAWFFEWIDGVGVAVEVSCQGIGIAIGSVVSSNFKELSLEFSDLLEHFIEFSVVFRCRLSSEFIN